MTITLICVGKTDSKALKVLVEDYEKRLGRFIKYQVEIIPDLKNRKKLSEEEQKTEEGKLILAKLKSTDFLVLLDENGKEFNSISYSKWMQKQMNKGLKNLVFVIGGPYGFSDEVYQIAKLKVSLSQMTFSHQMVRLFFTEQTYRAFSILNNLPYHHQ
jgi:23S rRNA (pseudouridine1915-N3)-methyltransferase